MIWELDWGVLAPRDVLHMPWRTASRLCAAVIHLAETGHGPVVRMFPREPRRLKLVLPGGVAYLFVDDEAGVLRVLRLFATPR